MRYLKVWLAILLVLSQVGCWDRRELEERAFVVAIGLDKGENNELDITYQIANPQIGVQTQAPDEKPAEIVTLAAPDFLSARHLANASVSRYITFLHTFTIVVSEELAKNDRFPATVLSALRDREVRRDMSLIVTREKAAEFINNNKPVLETRPHKYYQLMTERWQETGLVPLSTLNRFAQRTESDTSLFLAIYATAKDLPAKNNGYEDQYKAGEVEKKGGNPAQMIGSAVFKHGKMIATLTGEETRLALLLRPYAALTQFLTSYPDPLADGYRIPARIKAYERPRISIDWKTTPISIDVRLPVAIDILAIPSLVDYPEDMEKQEKLRLGIEQYLDTEAARLIFRTQSEFRAEPFQWALAARGHFSRTEDFYDADWMEKYTEATVRVTFNVKLQNFGNELRPPRIGPFAD